MSGTHGHGHAHDHHAGTAKAVSVTLVVNIVIMIAKWFAFALTRSPSLFGEAAHSTADTLNPFVLWIGQRRSARPAHRRHPLGHGREAFFWSLIAAELMLVVGAVLTARHGIETLLTGRVPHVSRIALAVMGMAAVGETYSLLVVWRRMRKTLRAGARLRDTGNTMLLALLVENSADILGVTLACAGYGLYVATGNAVWDACFSLAIAALLGVSSLFLIDRSRSLLIGEAAPPDVEHAVLRLLQARRSIAEVRRIVTVMRGPEDVGCIIVLRWDPEWFAAKWRAIAGGQGQPQPLVPWVFALTRAEADAIKEEVRAHVPAITQLQIEIT
ncbi:MAG TPA: cation diffusion facilitator family transporter [Candidatus Binatia bacterium]|jgi:cation diffusion facilitator family transporter|nr:cation diffusion facilitator family transporter [Candidatus Binatia bacterium]